MDGDGPSRRRWMSVQAVKACGRSADAVCWGMPSFGSECIMRFFYEKSARRFRAITNRAGGLECGITNVEDVVVRRVLEADLDFCAKPVAYYGTGHQRPVKAAPTSDRIGALVPAGAVVGRSYGGTCAAKMLFCKNFGGDSHRGKCKRNFRQLCQTIDEFLKPPATAARSRPLQRPLPCAQNVIPIVKLWRPVLEKPGRRVKKFGPLNWSNWRRHMFFASDVFAQGVGIWPLRKLERACDCGSWT